MPASTPRCSLPPPLAGGGPTGSTMSRSHAQKAGEARHTLRLCAYTSGGSEGVSVRVDEVDS